MSKQYISWRRVSTKKQGQSGLGLEAQADIIRYFVEREQGELVADYTEVYTGKDLQGCKMLRKAMAHAKKIGAVLVIAKSDRFRNTAEALAIYEEMGEGGIMFCDLPHTDKFTLTLFFALAEREALITSIRTKQALRAKRERGEIWTQRYNTTEAVIASAKARTDAKLAWEAQNEAFNLVAKRLAQGWSRAQILEDFAELYKLDPKRWCTRNGAQLSKGVLSKWCRIIEESGRWIPMEQKERRNC